VRPEHEDRLSNLTEGFAMSPINRAKMSKVIAMLCSNHEGERANALRALDRIMVEHGLTWTDIAQAFEGASSARLESPRSNPRDDSPRRNPYRETFRNMVIAFGLAAVLVASIRWFNAYTPDPPKPQTLLEQPTTATAQPVQKSAIEELPSATALPVHRYSDEDSAQLTYKDKKFSKLMEILCRTVCSDEEMEEARAISNFPDKFVSADGICPPGYQAVPIDRAHCRWKP
jgi:hypothetical protein